MNDNSTLLLAYRMGLLELSTALLRWARTKKNGIATGTAAGCLGATPSQLYTVPSTVACLHTKTTSPAPHQTRDTVPNWPLASYQNVGPQASSRSESGMS